MADQQTYRDRWAKADFDGFEFLTDSHDAKGGRRLVVHEFPGAEEPEVEDMGGKSREFQINAYFIGASYDLECNGLMAKLNRPGARWLTHPWLGLLWVRAHQWSRQESSDKNGYCSLTIAFVPGGEQPYSAEPDKVDIAIDRTHKLADAAQDDFDMEPMSADGLTAFVAAVQGGLEVVRQVISLATLPLTWAQQIMGLVASIKGELATLAGLPGEYANALRGLTDALGLGSDAANFSDVAQDSVTRFATIGTGAVAQQAAFSDTARVRLVSCLAAQAQQTSIAKLSGVAAGDGVVRRNLLRERDLRCRLFLVAAAQVALADYRSEADREAALASVISAFDVLLPGLPDPVFQAAVSARTALIEALMAQDLKPQSVRDVVSFLPATVLAHRLGVDEATFMAQNNVRHPLFVRGRVYG
ncbi:DNA circularization N-terminal domain-containing protein [Methylobacter tundripaludum]|uniref:DNA circularization N-terminal domain-containing protein n=1 Tax=Methylobacter tundripaludum TaxID=173365 RepID=UPI0004DF7B4D|nr:DNA circularization N-terminal domain-containing protein [Methylobacter tundripaludum]